jgi:glycosyltransferase involved in cell wall biosynthesis
MSVYNGARFLPEAVESILGQSWSDFEFVIVNDGSTDETWSILECYRSQDSRVRLVDQEKLGLTASLNRGCSLSRGEFIARMDADDVAMPRRLERQMHFMATHPGVGVLGGAFELIDATGKRMGVSWLPSEDHEIRRMLLDSTAFLHPSVLMSRSALGRVGGYREVKYAEDYDLWLRLAEQTKLANLREVIHQYRVHPEQVSVSKCKEQALWTGVAKIAAEFRRKGKPDPINTLTELTPEILETMGVSRILQQTNTARGLLRCVRNLYRGGELQLAIQALEAMRSEDLPCAERWLIADSYLWAARLSWNDGQRLYAFASLLRALQVRPIISLRPVRHAIDWLRRSCDRFGRTHMASSS